MPAIVACLRLIPMIESEENLASVFDARGMIKRDRLTMRSRPGFETMCMFLDSPIEYCPVANRYVLLDQTQDCCARDMDCPAVDCPLAHFFASPLRRGGDKPDGSSMKGKEQTGSNRMLTP